MKRVIICLLLLLALPAHAHRQFTVYLDAQATTNQTSPLTTGLSWHVFAYPMGWSARCVLITHSQSTATAVRIGLIGPAASMDYMTGSIAWYDSSDTLQRYRIAATTYTGDFTPTTDTVPAPPVDAAQLALETCNAAATGKKRLVVDAASTSVCTGGGTADNVCECNGTSWVDAANNPSSMGAAIRPIYLDLVSTGTINEGTASIILKSETTNESVYLEPGSYCTVHYQQIQGAP